MTGRTIVTGRNIYCNILFINWHTLVLETETGSVQLSDRRPTFKADCLVTARPMSCLVTAQQCLVPLMLECLTMSDLMVGDVHDSIQLISPGTGSVACNDCNFAS